MAFKWVYLGNFSHSRLIKCRWNQSCQVWFIFQYNWQILGLRDWETQQLLEQMNHSNLVLLDDELR